MKRATYRSVESYIAALKAAYDEIKSCIKKRQPRKAKTLLVQSQELAIELGDLIEQSEGDNAVTIPYIEDYCEELYQIHQTLVDNPGAVTSCIALQNCLEKIESSVKNDITVKIEILFLPYKKAMWDSMESVWQAAGKDASCNASVMPVPYYDKNPDGTLGLLHDEADLFEMPVLDWKSYSLPENCPDVVVIHNPYDQCNRATSVHPAFYIKELRKYADKVVYIPYFICQNDIVRRYYCVLPATLYADLVVLQSEKVRQQYIDMYAEDTGLDNDLEKRFVALGSPKLDTKAEPEILPEEWQRLIYRGKNRRKVIFFNTHLSCALKSQIDKFERKMQDIISLMKERDDIVFLWRPHPLTLSSARAMNPEGLERYQRIVERFKNEGTGIYDDSPDYHPAAAAADAYYGSKSSMAEIFRAMGKPVLLMNMGISRKADR